MIPRIHERAGDAGPVLSDALDRPLFAKERLTGATLVAWWPGLEAYAGPEPSCWTTPEWAEHLSEPLFQHPSTSCPEGDRRAVFHLDVRLAPGDRPLARPEWAEIAHHIARAAGIAVPGDEQGCRWIAVQAQPRRLDLIANLIRLDGTWQRLPSDHLRRVADEARRLEADLGLISPARPPSKPVPDAAAQAATLLAQLSDETSGPLAPARGVIEHLSQRLVGHPQAHVREAAHHLEWTARRLLDLQQDLAATATTLNSPPTPTSSTWAPGISARPPAPGTGARPMA